jgi:DNA-binding NarL/FixJ family response regulator
MEGGQNGHRPVVVADADKRARAGLVDLLTEAGLRVHEVASGDDALVAARRHDPVLFILEVALGRLSGYEVCRALREELAPDIPIMFVSGIRTESYDRVAGLLLGADDYVVKPYAPDELLARVRRLVSRARAHASPVITRLTPREVEVLRLLAEGSSADEIAERFVISAKTVATHVEHILTKLNVNSRVQAVAVAYREGLVEALTSSPV